MLHIEGSSARQFLVYGLKRDCIRAFAVSIWIPPPTPTTSHPSSTVLVKRFISLSVSNEPLPTFVNQQSSPLPLTRQDQAYIYIVNQLTCMFSHQWEFNYITIYKHLVSLLGILRQRIPRGIKGWRAAERAWISHHGLLILPSTTDDEPSTKWRPFCIICSYHSSPFTTTICSHKKRQTSMWLMLWIASRTAINLSMLTAEQNINHLAFAIIFSSSVMAKPFQNGRTQQLMEMWTQLQLQFPTPWAKALNSVQLPQHFQRSSRSPNSWAASTNPSCEAQQGSPSVATDTGVARCVADMGAGDIWWAGDLNGWCHAWWMVKLCSTNGSLKWSFVSTQSQITCYILLIAGSRSFLLRGRHTKWRQHVPTTCGFVNHTYLSSIWLWDSSIASFLAGYSCTDGTVKSFFGYWCHAGIPHAVLVVTTGFAATVWSCLVTNGHVYTWARVLNYSSNPLFSKLFLVSMLSGFWFLVFNIVQ